MPAPTHTASHGPPWRILGAAMLAHLGALVLLKRSLGLEPELLWTSHVALGLGGAGLLLRSRTLATTAFVSVAALHALWLFDLCWALFLHRFPLGLTTYVLDCDRATLLATSHHAYLAPLLAVWLASPAPPDATATRHPLAPVPGALAVIAIVTITSRPLASPSLNVNFAHAVLPASHNPLMVWFNALPWYGFLPIHLAFVLVVFLIPGALAAHALTRLSRRGRAGTGPAHHAPVLARAGRSARHAFTLIELITVIVILGILAGVAAPKYIEFRGSARRTADDASIAGIKSALSQAFLSHRMTDAPAGQFITGVAQVAPTMHTGALPTGITINGARLQDVRGNLYNLNAETSTSAATISLYFNSGSS